MLKNLNPASHLAEGQAGAATSSRDHPALANTDFTDELKRTTESTAENVFTAISPTSTLLLSVK